MLKITPLMTEQQPKLKRAGTVRGPIVAELNCHWTRVAGFQQRQLGGMIGNLLADHDMGTSDFMTGLMKPHEKMDWMLRAMLEGGSK